MSNLQEAMIHRIHTAGFLIKLLSEAALPTRAAYSTLLEQQHAHRASLPTEYGYVSSDPRSPGLQLSELSEQMSIDMNGYFL